MKYTISLTSALLMVGFLALPIAASAHCNTQMHAQQQSSQGNVYSQHPENQYQVPASYNTYQQSAPTTDGRLYLSPRGNYVQVNTYPTFSPYSTANTTGRRSYTQTQAYIQPAVYTEPGGNYTQGTYIQPAVQYPYYVPYTQTYTPWW